LFYLENNYQVLLLLLESADKNTRKKQVFESFTFILSWFLFAAFNFSDLLGQKKEYFPLLSMTATSN
jgi:hypothetical protein